MILHRPYGIDDPYKRLPTERFPRDPEADDEVQIGFQTSPGASQAWVVLSTRGERQRVPAISLGEGLWVAILGRVKPGRYTYRIYAEMGEEEEASEDFGFEVGRWVAVEGIKEVHAEPHGVTLTLAASGVPARLFLTFPLAGVCRYELAIGANSPPAKGLACQTARDGDQLRITSEEIALTIDLNTLELTASRPGSKEAAFQGRLAGRWLMDSRGQVSRLETSFEVQPGEWLYGLGERFAHPNRRGHRWDVRVYEEYKEQGGRTYLPIPLVVSNRGYGLWLQVDEPSAFDLRGSSCKITLERLPTPQANLPLYLIVADKPYGVTASFTKLTGEPSVPPKWAFGPWMSANTWNSQARAEEAVERTLQEDVPATVLVLEAWSDEATFYVFNDAEYEPKPGAETHTLADFRFGGRWPDPKALIDRCHDHGIRVLLWQIPVHKKLDAPHPQHELDEAYMLEQGFCIQNADGSPYRNQGWWFEGALILDFTNPQASAWWFEKRRYLFDELHVGGMKTDGGEHLWGRELQAFDGRCGLELYNSYPNLYVGAYHAFVQECTSGDGVTFSRAGYTGAQRYPCHWAGDENSTWSAFKASIQAGLSAGVSGISMWGWDIGGFSGEIPTVELYLRSAAMALFCPVMQYHSELHDASENRDRSPWNIAERHSDSRALLIYRRFAQLRLRLLDYLYEEAQALASRGLPLMRYSALEYPEAHDFLAADPETYLFARDLLVAPVTEKGASTREVRLPPGAWVELWSGARFDCSHGGSAANRDGLRIVSVPAPLERIPAFVRDDSPNLERLLAIFGDVS
jgi:alpha-glucosidase (family GH31 glycosyl hydrolase)